MAVLVLDGAKPLDVGIPTQVFSRRPSTPCEVRVRGARPGAVRGGDGLAYQVAEGLEALQEADTVFVPGYCDPATTRWHCARALARRHPAVRVPVPVGSIVELNTAVARDVTREQVLAAYRTAADGPLHGILEFSEEPLVSSDLTGRHVEVVAWYDDEWGSSNRVVDTLELLAR